MKHCAPAFAAFTLMLTAGCDAPDPADYGGGAKGEATAKCITRTERADSSVTREQSGELCSCVTDKLMGAAEAALSGGGGMSKSSMERAFIGCAEKAGVEITG